jgi:hypothetical protein
MAGLTFSVHALGRIMARSNIKDGFQNPSKPTSTFQVPDIRLDRSDIKRIGRIAMLPEDLPDSCCFDGVTDNGPGSMGLNIPSSRKIKATCIVCLADQVHLSKDTWLGNTRRSPVLAYSSGPNDSRIISPSRRACRSGLRRAKPNPSPRA